MSDVHNPMTFSLNAKIKEFKNNPPDQKVTKIKWDGSKNDAYLQNIDDHEVGLKELLGLLERFKPSANTNESDIEHFLLKTNMILDNAKTKTFPPKTSFVSNSKKRAGMTKSLR